MQILMYDSRQLSLLPLVGREMSSSLRAVG